MNLRTIVAVAALLSAAAAPSRGADAPAPKPVRPHDAAEAVQEGNVQNWVEYYRRTRPAAPVAAPVPTSPPQPQPAPR